MAKAKEKEPTTGSVANIALSQIQKKFGSGVFIDAQDIIDAADDIIPISPSLDTVCGGIPKGSWVTLTGKPKTGKTTTALEIVKNCQDAGMYAFVLNAEGRLKKQNLLGVTGLKTDPKHMQIVGSTEDNILSAQDYLQIAEDILMSHKNCVMLIDSYSTLCHAKEQQEGIGTSTRGGGAALLAQFTRQLCNVVPVKKNIVVGITHIMANTSGYGANFMEKGGNAILYQVDVKLRVKSIEYWRLNDTGKAIGQKVLWICETNACGIAPMQEATSYIKYGHGIDSLQETIELGTGLGLIEQAGSWMHLAFLASHNIEPEKAQGSEKLYKLLESMPEWIKLLQQDIKALGV